MPASKPKSEYTIICDDIREEVGNKITFVGTYGPDIYVSKLPFSFPKLCFVNFLKDIRGGDSISLELMDPSGEQLGSTIKSTAPKDGIGHARKLSVFGIFTPLVVQKEGLYKFIIIFNNDEKSKQEIEFNIKVHGKT